MTDGTSFTGQIIKFDANGLMLRVGNDTYTNLMWGRFSQASLKQLAKSRKIAPYVSVFIIPTQSQLPHRKKINVQPVNRLALPPHPSLIGGLFGSALGWLILLLLYGANLYAGYEVSIIRARPAAQVIGVSAILPVIGPILFLSMSVKIEPEEELEPLMPAAPEAAGSAEATPAAEEVQVVDAAWKKEQEKPKPQVFARGKFTFNKRFVETKFGNYVGTPKGDALKFSMAVKTSKTEFAVERITMVTATEVIFEAKEKGQTAVPFPEIQEIQLIPIHS